MRLDDGAAHACAPGRSGPAPDGMKLALHILPPISAASDETGPDPVSLRRL